VGYAVAHEGLRPTMPPHCPPALAACAQACWSAEPGLRPPMAKVLALQRLSL
jgi:hypothetical protein